METRKYMLMYKLTQEGVIQTQYYVTEELARKDANELFKQGFVYIELFAKRRIGYGSIKRVDQHEGIAKAKHNAFINAAEQAALEYHNKLFA